jgi:Flp pilus assembly protein TadD
MHPLFRHFLLAVFLFAGALPVHAQSALDQAQTHWYAGRQAQAVETLEVALAAEPRQAKLRFALAWMRQERGELAAGEQLLRGLLEEFPDHAEAHNNLAVILAQRGELDQARLLLERAVQLQPEHAQAQENLGDLLLRLAQRAYLNAAKSSAHAHVQHKLRQLDPLLLTPKR